MPPGVATAGTLPAGTEAGEVRMRFEAVAEAGRYLRRAWRGVAAMLLAATIAASGAAASSARTDLTREQRENLDMVELDFAHAPAPMLEIARKIAVGEAPGEQELRALGPEIDRSYPNRPRNGETLLTAALRYRNLAAIDALLAAGADPHALMDPGSDSPQVSGWTFLFLATEAHGEWIAGEDRYDRTFGNRAIELYLRHGGDPDHRWTDDDRTLLDTVAVSNPDGFRMLIEAGADPRAPGRNDMPLHMRLVTRHGTNAHETIRYLAEAGFYDEMTDAQMEAIAAAAQRTLDMGVRTDPDEMEAFFYARFGHYADAVKLVIERSGYELAEDTVLHRLLYVDDHLYRQ